jgi:hypothetical protein
MEKSKVTLTVEDRKRAVPSLIRADPGEIP